MSFRITEEYCRLAQELEAAGYYWSPRAGDWMLDRDDGSIGMLTTEVRDQAYIRRLNTHLPTYVQTEALLKEAGVVTERNDGEVAFSRGGTRLITFARSNYDADHGTCLLRALGVAVRAANVSERSG
ncbi:MAG: hypothetical protein IT462_01425 [Planctomycetes bacterium]|nr:hypothetical protein [Planctomycetota bacterium]